MRILQVVGLKAPYRRKYPNGIRVDPDIIYQFDIPVLGIMEKKMEALGPFKGYVGLWGLYWGSNTGKENGNYYVIVGLLNTC